MEHIFKGKSLIFVDAETELAYQQMKEEKNAKIYKYYNILCTCLVLSSIVHVMIVINGNIKEAFQEVGEDEACKVGPRITVLYIVVSFFILTQIEHLLMKCNFMRFRGLIMVIATYITMTELANNDYHNFHTPALAIGFVSGFGCPLGVLFLGQDIIKNWLYFSVANFLGLSYFFIRNLIQGYQQQSVVLYGLAFFIWMSHNIYLYEKSSRIEFYLYQEAIKRENEWKSIFDKLPVGLLIRNKQDDQTYLNIYLGQLLINMHRNINKFREYILNSSSDSLRQSMNSVTIENHEISNESEGLNSTFLPEFINNINSKWRLRGSQDRIQHEIQSSQIEGGKATKYLEIQKIKAQFHFKESKIYIISDQSFMKEAELKLIKTAKEKEMFFASMSHELRNPLNALLASVELLKSSYSNIDREIIENASFCGEILLHLIGNILDVNKIESNKLEIYPQPANLYENIKKITAMLQANAVKKGLYLRFIFQNKTPIPSYYIYDQARLNQVLINLIANSIKFTSKGGITLQITWFPLGLQDIDLENEDLGPNDQAFQDIFEGDYYVNYEAEHECIYIYIVI